MKHPWFETIDWQAMIKKQIPAPYVPQLDEKTCTKHFTEEFTRMKLTPQEGTSLSSANNKWEDFTYKAQEIIGDSI